MIELIGKVLLGRALGRLNRRYEHVRIAPWKIVMIAVAILTIFVILGFMLPNSYSESGTSLY